MDESVDRLKSKKIDGKMKIEISQGDKKKCYINDDIDDNDNDDN